MTDHDKLVRERAYLLWEKAGSPDDRSLEFWFAAAVELKAEQPVTDDVPAPPVAEPVSLAEAPVKPASPVAVKPAA